MTQTHELASTAKQPEVEEEAEAGTQAIVVALRTRPFLPSEIEKAEGRTLERGVEVKGKNMIVKLSVKKWDGIRIKEEAYKADYAYGPETKNEQLYQDLLKSNGMINTVFGGGVGLVLAYGQTGSGKTHSIQALQHQLSNDIFHQAPEFASTHFPSSALPSDEVFEISLSVLEILGSKARDLLQEGNAVEISEDQHGLVQTTSSKHVVSSSSDLLDLIGLATSSRATSATQKNDTSSRSHCLLSISVQNKLFPMVLPGTLLVVDLAGSERATDREEHGPERLGESKMINESLSCLKDCVRARAMVESHRSEGKFIHVPYRSSKLTLALKSTFDIESTVNSQTVIIAHASPHLADASHSNNTLSYCQPFKVAPPKPTSAVVQPPSKWSNAQFKSFVAKNSTKIDPDKFAPNGETGLVMCNLSEEEFIQRALAAQKPGAGLKALGAKKFYILLWGLTVDAKYQSQPHVIAGRLAQRDPTSWTTFQVQDWISENSHLDPELFCPPPLRGKALMEMGEALFVSRVLRSGKEGSPPPTEEDASKLRKKLWAFKVQERTAGRDSALKLKPKLNGSVYDA